MSADVLHGDCREILPTLPDESVNCCVTSPPYWGLRDYGTATWEGGDEACDHKGAALASSSSLAGYSSENVKIRTFSVPFKEACGKCGARRIDSQIGLEPTPEAYVAELVAVFREVRRVMRADGTLWLNLGDSYSMSTKGAGGDGKQHTNAGTVVADRRWSISPGLKPKDLVGIPWRVAFALQADGWYLRSDIIWAKPNPMPESVTDRPTKSHEYVFLLTKSARYWYDAGAIQEPSIGAWNSAVGFGGDEKKSAGDPLLRTQGHGTFHADEEKTGRNARTVWTIATQPFSGAHFATMPPKLAERCILAGCPEGGTVLDPFGGAGTTGLVADRLGRNAVLIELNPTYAGMADRRIVDDAPLFAGGAA